MKAILISLTIVFNLIIFIGCSNNKKENSVNITSDSSISSIVKGPATKTDTIHVTEMYTCRMHNEVLSNKEGTCPKCGMKLVKQPLTTSQQKLFKEGTYLKSKEEQ